MIEKRRKLSIKLEKLKKEKKKELSSKFVNKFNESFVNSEIKANLTNEYDFSDTISFIFLDFALYREKKTDETIQKFIKDEEIDLNQSVNKENASIIYKNLRDKISDLDLNRQGPYINYLFYSYEVANEPVIILTGKSGDTVDIITISDGMLENLIIREKYQGLGIGKETINILKGLMGNFTVHSDYKCDFGFYYHQGANGVWNGTSVEFEF